MRDDWRGYITEQSWKCNNLFIFWKVEEISSDVKVNFTLREICLLFIKDYVSFHPLRIQFVMDEPPLLWNRINWNREKGWRRKCPSWQQQENQKVGNSITKSIIYETNAEWLKSPNALYETFIIFFLCCLLFPHE